MKNYPLSFVFYRLFLHLYPFPEKENEIYIPDSFLRLLGVLNKVYNSHKRRNPNDLISFFLNTLHDELNELKNNKKKIQLKTPNIYDKHNVIKWGVHNFQQNNKSIISNILNWFEIKQLRCTKCFNISYNFQYYNTFELDILETYKYKNNNNSITLIECLEYIKNNPKTQTLFCQKCGVYIQISSTSEIICLSNMIIFSLNRGDLENDKLINIPFKLQDRIDLTNLIENKNFVMNNLNYELVGVVSITKEENKNIFVSFCKSPVDQQWYFYKDDVVHQVNLNNVISFHNNGNYIPCILGYKALKNN